MPILAAIWPALLAFLTKYLPSLVGQVLLAFGVGLAVHTFAMPAFMNLVRSYTSGMSAWTLNQLGALGVDVCITMVFSAMTAAAAKRVVLSKLGPDA
ncbi:DUF2523 family protein [Coralloluteibacterium thermophilus]|uniref:DUF2523 family protein n=1 Tax=Coralloluteibacterium thermophilum TaxID=2707049 RepID=A0ABV9NQE1_9GAMM